MTEYKYKVSDFEGPLDLLLYLIEKNKVDIYNIPIVEITDQFNAYVAEIDTFDVDYASKFFVMAATLLQIKSRLLLPKQPKVTEEEEEDPQEALVRQLVEYKRMKTLANALGGCWEARSLLIGRGPTPMPYEAKFAGHIDTQALYEAFHKVCQALPQQAAAEIRIQKEIYSVEECMRRVAYALRRAPRGVLHVTAVFQQCRSRVELVVTFLAVLELLRVGRCATVAEGEDGNTVALRYKQNGEN